MPNNGKICVSICAASADEFNRKIKSAKPLADLIELRIDCLQRSEIEKIDLEYNENYILTFRPKEQGGNRELSLDDREKFWNSGLDFCGADLEEDVVENHLGWLYSPVICSYHDFTGTPGDLMSIYERIKFAGANIDVIKIAVQADDITDTIPVWKLLERAVGENQSIVPIAMGEAGKWTRILGLAHGAFMTYASLDAGSETAPGQVSARDLEDVYRVRELDANTEIYGILGGNTSVSMSPYIHNAAFRHHGLNAVFVPLQTRDLGAFLTRMARPATREIDLDFAGFAVTIPHKETIIDFLDETDDTARRIGAVNTVKIKDGKLRGYNTDAEGFIEPLINSYGDLRGARVAVLGAGGASRACIYALKKAGAEATVFARDRRKAETLAEEFATAVDEFPSDERPAPFAGHDILVNTTPLGMKNKAEGVSPVAAAQLEGLQLVYDLVYTPFRTELMKRADLAEVPKIGGLAMLIAQAAAQQKIWTGLDAPVREMSRAALERLG